MAFFPALPASSVLPADFAEGVNPGAFLYSPSAQGGYAFPLLARGAKEYTNNLYLRALVFNQEAAAQAAAQFVGTLEGKPFYQQLEFWKDFLNNGFKMIEYALKHDNSVTHMLLVQGSGVIMEAIQQAARTANAAAGSLKHWAVVLGGVSGKAVGFVRGTCSSPKGLLNFVGNRIYRSLYSSKASVLSTIFRADMLGEAHMQAAQGRPSIETNYMVAVDKGKISANMAEAEINQVFGYPARGEPSASHKRPLFGLDRNLFSKENVAVVGGIVSFFFNLACAGSALTAYREGGKRHPELKTEFTENELSARFGVGVIGCVASFSEAVSAGMQKALPPALLAQGMGFRLNTFLKFAAKGLGAVGSGIVAYRDWLGFTEAREQKKGKGLIIASFASTLISIVTFGIMFYSFVTYIIALFAHARRGVAIAEVSSIRVAGLSLPITGALAVLFAVGFMVGRWKDNEDRKANLKEWLSRSAFGKNGEKPKYSSLSVEQDALHAVFQ